MHTIQSFSDIYVIGILPNTFLKATHINNLHYKRKSWYSF